MQGARPLPKRIGTALMSKILVIEEDSAMRVLISEWVSSLGHEVHAHLRPEGVPDEAVKLVILDLPYLRSRRGAAMRTIEAMHRAYPHSSVIGISAQLGHSLGGGSSTARAFGVDRLVAKPCSKDELLDAVAVALAT